MGCVGLDDHNDPLYQARDANGTAVAGGIRENTGAGPFAGHECRAQAEAQGATIDGAMPTIFGSTSSTQTPSRCGLRTRRAPGWCLT